MGKPACVPLPKGKYPLGSSEIWGLLLGVLADGDGDPDVTLGVWLRVFSPGLEKE